MRRLALVLTLAAAPVHADPCESHFRAGMAAYRSFDAGLIAVEERLYAGLGWVTRRGVVARLEGLSAATTACQELAAVRDRIGGLGRDLGEAQRRFQLAAALCSGVNRSRAEGNLERLADSVAAQAELADYTRSLAPICAAP